MKLQNVKNQTLKVLEENISEYLHFMVKKFDQDTKILKFDRIKILNFCKIKYTIFE